MKKEEVKAVDIELDAGKNNSILSILLMADGSINRMGNGRLDNSEKVFHIGVTQEPLFQTFMSYVPDNLFDYAGGYDLPKQAGLPCKLTIRFHGRQSTGAHFEFNYGSESQGPPAEIQKLVIAAVAITDQWLQRENSGSVNTSLASL